MLFGHFVAGFVDNFVFGSIEVEFSGDERRGVFGTPLIGRVVVDFREMKRNRIQCAIIFCSEKLNQRKASFPDPTEFAQIYDSIKKPEYSASVAMTE